MRARLQLYITVLCTVCGLLHGRAPRDAIRYDAMPPPAAAAAARAAARAAQRSIDRIDRAL
jgi:hypothetical protein